ncbi:MAG: COX15/CtaA family protein, partial [Ferruginibacter sp.]
MLQTERQKNNRQVATWLLIGVGMIIVQVMIGGITRLTESGLSITEWKPITGALPPLNEAAWQEEFARYRNTDQFKYVHQHFSLHDFKFIFFWEWLHRLWARLMGIVFIIGFVYFIIRKKFSRAMIAPLLLLFLLGALQGAIGWLMVKSGLVPEKYFVGHVELTTHFIAALVLLAYTCWFAFSLLPGMQNFLVNPKVKNALTGITILFFIQLIFGGFMAGLHAAATAPTWPDINGNMVPTWSEHSLPIVNDPLWVQFTHRIIAYVLFFVVLTFFITTSKIRGSKVFESLRLGLFVLICLQVLLGILTVLNATQKNAFVVFGVAHQFMAM